MNIETKLEKSTFTCKQTTFLNIISILYCKLML